MTLLLAVGALGGCLLLASCEAQRPAPPAPLSIALVEKNSGTGPTIEVRTDPPQANLPLTVTVLPPGPGQPLLERDPGFFGLAGVQLTWLPAEQREREIEWAAASGARYIGLDFDWRRIEPEQDQFDWEATDAVVALAKEHGLRLVPMLIYTPRWASSTPEAFLDGHIAPPRDYSDYRDFVFAVVDRYRPHGRSPLTRDGYGITDWVIWNEPGVHPSDPELPVRNEFWAGGMAAYVQLLRAGYEGAHAADPGCNVLNGGLADVTWATEDLTLPRAVERLYDPNGDGDAGDGGRPYFDTLNIHTYPPGLPDPAWYAERLGAVRAVMERFDDVDKAVWLTETGYGTAPKPQGSPYLTEAAQAEGVEVAYQACASIPYLERTFWWSLRDYYRDDSAANQAMEAHYGLLRAGFAPKPAYFAYARLTGAAGEAQSWTMTTGEDGTARLELPADVVSREGRYLIFALGGDGSAASMVVTWVP